MVKNVKKYAHILEALCIVLIPVVLFMTTVMWFFGDNFFNSTYGVDLHQFSMMQRLGLYVIQIISSFMVVYGFITCIKLARSIQHGLLFTQQNVTLFSRLANIATWWSAYNMAEGIFFQSFVFVKNPKFFTALFLGASSLIYLFVFIFSSILATIISKAGSLEKDQELTV